MGEPKAFVELGGEVLLVRVARRVGAFCDPVVVVAQEGQALPECPGVRVVRDPIPGEGPLVGVTRGLRAVREGSELGDEREGGSEREGGEIDWAFVCTTDAPWIEAAVIRRMGALGGGFDAVVAGIGEKPHVLTALYRPAVAEVAERLVREGVRRASRLAAAVKTRLVTREELLADDEVLRGDPELRTFENVNTREELGRARGRERERERE